jgi:hypothetical protein
MKVVFAIMVQMAMMPARGEHTVRLREPDATLQGLQKAVGKDWSVTALPDGYLFAYGPLVSFYPAISEHSKWSDVERRESGRRDHLEIKITYLFPPSIKKVDAYNAFWWKVHAGVPGFYECDNAHWCIERDDPSAEAPRLLSFSTNMAPDQLVPPSIQEDVYEHTLDRLASYFHYIRHAEPWVCD